MLYEIGIALICAAFDSANPNHRTVRHVPVEVKEHSPACVNHLSAVPVPRVTHAHLELRFAAAKHVTRRRICGTDEIEDPNRCNSYVDRAHLKTQTHSHIHSQHTF